MAVDKLVDSTQLDADLTSVADAIRTKGGTSASLAFPSGFVSAINAIPTGGGSVIQPLSVTANGTYTAPSGVDGYSPVTVNVSGGGGGEAINALVSQGENSVSVSYYKDVRGTSDTLCREHELSVVAPTGKGKH